MDARLKTVLKIEHEFMTNNDIEPIGKTLIWDAEDYDDIIEQIVAEYWISKGIIVEAYVSKGRIIEAK